MSIARADWKSVGSVSNADMYELRPDILVIVPHQDSTDTEGSARESLAFQDAHWRKQGRRGAVVCFMDPVIAQEAGARAVYTNEAQNSLTTCFALVGETFFGHATAAVFEGLAKPVVPTQVFRALDDALPWIEEMNRSRGGRV